MDEGIGEPAELFYFQGSENFFIDVLIHPHPAGFLDNACQQIHGFIVVKKLRPGLVDYIRSQAS
jgi:hypothetical protein